MTSETLQDELESLRRDMHRAIDIILGAAQDGLSRLPSLRTQDKAGVEYLSDLFCAVLEACTFEDLASQRLSKLERQLGGRQAPASDEGGLLNGPALHGQGLDQAAADDLFADLPATPEH